MDAQTSDVHADERVLWGQTGRLSLVLASGWLATMLTRGVLPPLLPSIVDGLAMTESQAGFALTVMWAVYALLHYPAGRVSDQLSHRTVLTASLFVTGAGIVSLFRVASYGGFVLAVSLVGVGAGLYFAPSRALLSDVFVARRSEALGVQAAAGTLGSAAAGGLAIAALAVGPWQSAFPPILALLCVVVVLIQLSVDEPLVLSRVSFGFVRTGRRLLSSRRTRVVLVAYVAFSFVWTGVVTFLPSFLQAAKDLSPFEATIGYALVFVVSTVTGPVAGNVGDRWSRTRVAAVGLALGAAGLVALLVTSSLLASMGSVVAVAAGFRSFPPVMQSYLLGEMADDSAGGDFGALKSLYTGLGSVGTTYVGVVAGAAGYEVAFWGFVPVAAFGLLVVVGLLLK